ncbi:restriction endonuclease [Methanosarcina sp. Mfa9]|uniref:restriction endonuclease n=1 Tax=Methanosarcina sp. Mfa9 TaxID=3439063 RepID=UPI003F84B6CE
MQTVSSIRILEAENNKRGDLFNRLMEDLFSALGYHNFRRDIPKAGREIDIRGTHRTEKRRLFAECKAMKKKVGGEAINTFLGKPDIQKSKEEIDTVAYFVSLNGFTSTALEQEEEVGKNRIILLDGRQVIEELIRGHKIASPETAMERAGRCAFEHSSDLKLEENCELLACEMGWIWAIYFTQNKQRTHFALIHADGESIGSDLAESVIEKDRSVGGILHSLKYLNPKLKNPITQEEIRKIKEKYFTYLAAECGKITLEGLPADQNIGPKSLKLENIFVPLYFEKVSNSIASMSSSRRTSYLNFANLAADSSKLHEHKKENIGEVISKHSKLAILAPPGGGKTTLLKSLAIAYAFPERSTLIDSNLPEKSWIPIFIRCRQLGDLIKSSITEILNTVPQRAEMSDLAEPFTNLIKNFLRNGEILLLIDGLDEISSEGVRLSFVNQLCTFLSIYPNTNIIITSREAGFRKVAGILSEYCEHYSIADLNDEDITKFTIAWHKEVIGNKTETLEEAKKLACNICAPGPVKVLAKNPLLLTTLLLVNRWVGQLPTKRTVLYEKTVELLLWTWNVEGHERIEPDEAIPQLAFVAFYMMKKGTQRISSKELKQVLISARKQMPDILDYAKFGHQEFIHRIELRTSLMILSGHEDENGNYCPMYEFQHLTFQEYFAALAIVEGYYPERKESDTLLKILKPYLHEDSWKEVISLATVLSGRDSKQIISHLIKISKQGTETYLIDEEEGLEYPISKTTQLLALCILEGVKIPPNLLDEGLKLIAKQDPFIQDIKQLLRGKYSERFENVVQETFMNSSNDLKALGSTLAMITLEEINWYDSEYLTPEILDKVYKLLDEDNIIQKVKGNLAVAEIFQRCRFKKRFSTLTHEEDKSLTLLAKRVIFDLRSDEMHLNFAACYAFARSTYMGYEVHENIKCVILRLFEILKNSDNISVQRVAAWAILCCPVIDRELDPFPSPTLEELRFVKNNQTLHTLDHPGCYRISLVSLIMAFYWKKPWTDAELKKEFVLIKNSIEQDLPLSDHEDANYINNFLAELSYHC